ncbi:MAG: AsmA family protein [Burkholderiales bacterium]|nr:AsmA family protein [Burkholderiales bacterium]
MNKTLKAALLTLGGLLALVAAGITYLLFGFDPNDVKPLAIARVQQDYHRTLAIPGRIELSIWPVLGVKLGAVSLSERDNSQAEFASIKGAQVGLALWPLLTQRQLQVNHVVLDGLQAQVVRGADGKLSIADLLAKPPPQDAPAGSEKPAADKGSAKADAGAPLSLDIAGVAITDAKLVWDDREAPRRVTLSKARVELGRFAPGVTTPITLAAHVDATAPKAAVDIKLDGTLALGPAEGDVTLAGLKLDIGAQVDGQVMSVKLAGTLQGQTAAQRWAFEGLKLDASLPGPGGKPMALEAQGAISVALAGKGRVDAQLAGRFDDSQFKTRLSLPRLAPIAYVFDAEVDKLDLDRYIAKAPTGAAKPAATAASGPEPQIDLSALRELDASGQLRIGALQLMNLKLAQVNVGLKAAGGQVNIAPIAAKLYEGSISGSASVSATSPPRVALQQELAAISIAPLLTDLAQVDRLAGHGNVSLDVSTSGATVSAMTKALAGRAKVALRDGAVKGINIAQAIRRAKAQVSGVGAGGDGKGTAATSEATDFSEMSASFVISQGVAHSDDLDAKTPLMRIGGSGDIDLGGSRLDYLVKATVVATLEGQGGADLQALRGQTIPVRLSGPLNAIGWKIDVGAMAKEKLGNKIETRREEIKQDAKDKVKEKLKGLLGR